MDRRRRVQSRLMVIAAIVGILTAGGLSPSAAASGSSSESETATLAQPAVEIFDFVLMNIGDSGGGSMAFPAGQEVCVNLHIDPSPVGGGSVLTTPCFSSVPDSRTWGNNPPTPFLRSSNYWVSIASNTTACTFTLPAMQPADYGEGGWYAIFNIVASCPSEPPPATTAPSSTTAPPATTAPSPTPIPDEYDSLGLFFSPIGSTPAVLPGAVCVRIVTDPPFTGTSLYDFCTTNSSTNTGFGSDPGESFPTTSIYSAMIVSNASGCLVTAGPLREASGDSGFLGIIDVTINCDLAPVVTVTPTPIPSTPPITATATSTSVPESTVVVTETATETVVPSATIVETPSPTGTTVPETTVTPTGDIPATSSPPSTTGTSPVFLDPTSYPGSGVTKLPTTGAGDNSPLVPIALLLTGVTLLALAFWFDRSHRASTRHRQD